MSCVCDTSLERGVRAEEPPLPMERSLGGMVPVVTRGSVLLGHPRASPVRFPFSPGTPTASPVPTPALTALSAHSWDLAATKSLRALGGTFPTQG